MAKSRKRPAVCAAPAQRQPAQPPKDGRFPVVGIGASAGGLEALERFFKQVPPRCGMAFVVIQHLDPTRKGIMRELLQRITQMPVLQVKDRMRIMPDCVYLIPPNKDMSVLHGVLHLMVPAAPRGLRLPIDFFFRSLADDRRERGACVILSGMGTDGTLGLRAIKERDGVVLVQEPASAKFAGMPRSAIETGLADIVAAPEELPGKMAAYFQHVPVLACARPALEEKTLSALEKVVLLLRSQTGHDFTMYKKSTVYRRIERRMGVHQVDRIDDYVQYLRKNPAEVDILFKELLIGVTSFFRDPAAWDKLRDEALPALFASRPAGTALRAWSAGCSTGEEAYSIAIAFKEAAHAAKLKKNLTLQVFATDLDQDAIDRARLGIFPANIAADVSPERLSRFFVKAENGYRVAKEIREMVIFAQQNVIMDPPFTKLDLAVCRNLLIYLDSELQRKLLPLFHYSLNRGGLLFLGNAESIGGFAELFEPFDAKTRLFRRREAAYRAEPVEFPASFAPAVPEAPSPPEPAGRAANVQALADQIILQKFAPAAVLVNDKGDILYVSGRTGKYLEPAAGKANWNIFAMTREELRYDLSQAFKKAAQTGRAAAAKTQRLEITVTPISEPAALRGMLMVVFTDAPAPARQRPDQAPAARSAREGSLERELARAQEELQTTREEMQTSQEELKSTNEEMQSTNEELQSTNEELTTSKEELQSLNEELHTVNAEMQVKVDELSRTNNDMQNLLDSTDIATVFLDGELRIRRFTPRATKIISLIPADAGRPFSDIASDLVYPELNEDAREVLRTLAFTEKHVASLSGRWFQVRLMPYRTQENRIDGVVLTFIDITGSKRQEKSLRESESSMRGLLAATPLVWTCAKDGAWDFVDRRWTDYTGVPEQRLKADGWLKLLKPAQRAAVKAAWEAGIASGEAFQCRFSLCGKDGRYRGFRAHAQPIPDARGQISQWYCHASEAAADEAADVPA